MKYYAADAIIIKAMNYGESTRIFTLFSREYGKLSAIAKGVKRPKSTMKGHLQLGNRCNLMLYQGKSMDTISQAVALETYPQIRSNPQAYLYVSYFMELLNIALPEKESNSAVFDLTHQVFSKIDNKNTESMARYFEINLMTLIGYEVDFKRCSNCGEPLKEGYLSSRFPGPICKDCGGGVFISPQAIYGLDYYNKTPIEQLNRLKLNEETEKIMAKVMQELVAYHLERRIKSLDIIRNSLWTKPDVR
ncbi:MAG: DNA repair protein RecO [Clostridiales bacterium]